MIALLLMIAAASQLTPPSPAAQTPAAQTLPAPPLPVPVPLAAANPTPVAAPLPPQDWSGMPVLRYRRPTAANADTAAFVHGEVAAGRCTGAVRTTRGWSLNVDLALLAAADGRVRRVTPRAIGCPTVEQYAAGLLIGTARDNIDQRGAAADTWYRTSMVFAWAA